MLTCDFEEFNLPIDFGKTISEKLMLSKSCEGIERFIDVIKKYPVKISFFVTPKMSEVSIELLRKLVKEGHEIGFHGSINQINSDNVTRVINDLRYLKEEMEKKIKIKIYGFRNHKLIILPAYVIKEAGFVYDNTCHPTYVPTRYFNLFRSRNMRYIEGIINIPTSVSPILRLPFSWIWFRNLGLNYVKLCTRAVFLTQDYVNIYLHSWDFAYFNDNSISNLPYLIKRNTGIKMSKLFEDYLIWCLGKKINVHTIYYYLCQKYFL